ncbi:MULTISPECIES: hypothetical protein [Priestia]|nr:MULTISPECIES: hypothetical protein [Priestia]UYP09273.1 hypothetical protein OIJ04_06510 [Priestia megaterium]
MEKIGAEQETVKKENEKTNFTWVEEYPTILEIVNEYYSTCR